MCWTWKVLSVLLKEHQNIDLSIYSFLFLFISNEQNKFVFNYKRTENIQHAVNFHFQVSKKKWQAGSLISGQGSPKPTAVCCSHELGQALLFCAEEHVNQSLLYRYIYISQIGYMYTSILIYFSQLLVFFLYSEGCCMLALYESKVVTAEKEKN